MDNPIRILVIHNRHWGHIAYVSGLDKADVEILFVDEDEVRQDMCTADHTEGVEHYSITDGDMLRKLERYGNKEEE